MTIRIMFAVDLIQNLIVFCIPTELLKSGGVIQTRCDQCSVDEIKESEHISIAHSASSVPQVTSVCTSTNLTWVECFNMISGENI